jgi:4,5-DOPA dioxygenase extradiol
MQSAEELKAWVDRADLWSESTNNDQCDNCRFYRVLREDKGYDWAQRFDEAARAVMQTAPAEVARLTEHRDYRLAVPTPDHFIPLLYLAGLAAAAGQGTEVLVDGFAMGSISMTAYTLAAGGSSRSPGAEPSPPLPRIPADETNT